MTVYFTVAPFSDTEGDLVSVRVSTEPRLLEDLLDCLARLSFPINPQIYHGRPTVVEFPAYKARLSEVGRSMQALGFPQSAMKVELPPHQRFSA